MERQIQDQFEDYLDGRLNPAMRAEFDRLLQEHPHGRRLAEGFGEQSQMIRAALRVPELAPAPGFYARVMSRIEEQAQQQSFWSVFAEGFGQRLVYASAVLLILIGAAIYTADRDGEDALVARDVVESPAVILVDDQPDVHLVGETGEDRGRVFVTLTAVEQ